MPNNKDNSDVISEQKWTAYGVEITVPGNFFVKTDNQLFIRLGGLFNAADQLGGYTLKTELIHDEYSMASPPEVDTRVVIKATAKLIPNRAVQDYLEGNYDDVVIEALGSATKLNLKSRVSVYPYEMADTRATARVLRKLTHCAFTAIEELGAPEKPEMQPGELRKAVEAPLSKRERHLSAVEKLLKKDPLAIKPRVQEYLEEQGLNAITNCDEKQAEELYQRAVKAKA